MATDASHARIAEAFARVPREPFLPTAERISAGDNVPLPIGQGQTNSQPSTVADMLLLLAPRSGDTVLDLGSGSGWTSALLAGLVGAAGKVIGVERHPVLVESSRRALDEWRSSADGRQSVAQAEGECDIAEVAITAAVPGTLGLPEEAPFDRILVSAGADSLPTELVDQLAIGATMVIPVAGEMLKVVRSGRGAEEVTITRHGWYRFVPLVSG